MVFGIKIMSDKSRRRHIAKAITWRIVGTLDTMVLAWIISGNPITGLKIGLAEVTTKMILYYFHERIWFRTQVVNPNTRHLIKTITWRILGTIDTIILAWVISGDPMIGLKIGLVEVLTKMVLYYFHERIWYKFDYGLEQRKS
ncbi:putative membrane protein [Flavobacteriaceae bacterium MAR_2010_72]|nr:putative membrane protein [Flavobacteriaceae bacterium MAR_2010_72]TVZ58277.1 putative membrane protein [Flavobacteriaceae bacterium MAR_2010_105]